MIINRSFIYRIYLTKKQKENFRKIFEKNVFLFNLLLKIRKKQMNNENYENIFIKDLVKEYKELSNGNLLAYISTYHNVDIIIKKYKNGYINGFPKDKNIDKYPKKLHFNIKTTFYLNENKTRIFISKIGNFKIRYHRKIPNNSYIRNIIIEEKLDNEFYLNIGISENHIKTDTEVKKLVGLDYSSTSLFVTSDNERGDQYLVREFLTNKIVNIQKKMQNCVLNSKNYLKLKHKLRKLHQKIANKREFYLHRACNDLLIKFDLIATETLSLTNIASHHKLGKHTYSNAYNKFLSFLNYKSILNDKIFIKIPQFYPSTKICSNCGKIKKIMYLDDRMYQCECGFICNRDLNAAINIRNKGLDIFHNNIKKDKIKAFNNKNGFLNQIIP